MSEGLHIVGLCLQRRFIVLDLDSCLVSLWFGVVRCSCTEVATLWYRTEVATVYRTEVALVCTSVYLYVPLGYHSQPFAS